MTQPLLLKGALLNSGRYHIDDVLGQGGFGVVYLATHQGLQTQVAIKATADVDTDTQRAFLDEARLLSRLRHTHLPRVTDYFIDGQQPYLVMDYIAGKDLEQVLSEHGGPLSEAEALPWVAQVLDALAYLHRQTPPIIHRDIKPANIRLAHDGTVYLVDFGIAKVGGGGMHTQMAARAVSPPFSPPEQYGGAAHTDTYSDVYALGATLYVLLTRELLPDSMLRQAGHPTRALRQLNPHVSQHVEQLVMRALELPAGARYANAEAFLAALNGPTVAVVSPKPQAAAPIVVPGPSCPRCSAPPITPNAPFCHACGAPILLRFPTISRQLDDPANLTSTCDQAWQDALILLQSGMLQRWLEARGQTTLLAQLQTTQARFMGNTDAILEAFLRPNPPQDLDADPIALDFGTCTLDARPRLTVALRRRSPGYIHGRLRGEAPWLTLSSPAIAVKPYEPGATFAVGVELAQLTTGDAQHDYSSAVVIDTNQGSLRLPVRITVSNPPRARLQPAAVQLGKVEALRRSGGNVAIVNEGGGVIAGAVRAEQPWLTVEAQHAQFSLGYYQHATVNFGVATEQLTPMGAHRGTLVWETNLGTLLTDIHVEVTPPYAVEPGDPTTAIRQKFDLVKLCDCEPRRGINNWERGSAWLRNGRILAALRFLGEDVLAQTIEEWARFPDVNIGMERVLRALGAKPAHDYKDNSSEVVKQIMGVFGRKRPVVEYVILNRSKRGYLHGYVRPLAEWLGVPEPRFGCMPGEEATIQLYPDYKRRTFGDLFEPVIE